MEDLLNKWEYNILKNLGITGTYTTALYRYDITAFLISTFMICLAASSKHVPHYLTSFLSKIIFTFYFKKLTLLFPKL